MNRIRILANNSIKAIPRFAFSRYTVLEIMWVVSGRLFANLLYPSQYLFFFFYIRPSHWMMSYSFIHLQSFGAEQHSDDCQRSFPPPETSSLLVSRYRNKVNSLCDKLIGFSFLCWRMLLVLDVVLVNCIVNETLVIDVDLNSRYLSMNAINWIEPSAFKGLTNVKRLFLDGNLLNDTSLDSLNSLPNLQWL